MVLSKEERGAKLELLGVRCQWYTRGGLGPRCSRYGTNWKLDRGRYCTQHAIKAWGAAGVLW